VRGALFDDGHGMRKRKDSPPGMLPSRDGKYTPSYSARDKVPTATGQAEDNESTEKEWQGKQKLLHHLSTLRT
jgi:hypothetical protein